LNKLPDFSKGDGLLPAIAQDHETGQVLMLAWMNEESFLQTLNTRHAVYFSRSRNQLWKKGEQSGHTQQVMAIHVDCDGDAILLKVRQRGVACHNGYYSCFYRRFHEADQSEKTQETAQETAGTEWKIVDEPIVDPSTMYDR